jgi:hypothetical protein
MFSDNKKRKEKKGGSTYSESGESERNTLRLRSGLTSQYATVDHRMIRFTVIRKINNNNKG